MYRVTASDCGASHRLYLREICQTPLLSAQEERDLAAAIARGDRDARNRMVQANLRLVVKIAREYLGRGMVLEDLIGEGNVGLILAAEAYDPQFGTRFSTYASYWIKVAIVHALIYTTATIRLPSHVFGLTKKWRRADQMLCRERGRAPSFDEVAAYLGLTERQRSLVAKAQRANQLKLESSLGDADSSWSLDESIDTQPGLEDSIQSQEDLKDLASRMHCLDERELKILESRFGLSGESPLTLEETGNQLGVTKEWIRALQKRAIRKLGSWPGFENHHPCRPQVPV